MASDNVFNKLLRDINATVSAFEERSIDLRALIDSLEHIIPSIPDSQFNIKQTLEDCSSDMEIVYAMAASDNRKQLNEDQAKEIYARIDIIKNVISSNRR